MNFMKSKKTKGKKTKPPAPKKPSKGCHRFGELHIPPGAVVTSWLRAGELVGFEG
jgi:hypothetical protein